MDVSASPASAEPITVLLWVITILVGVAVWVVRQLFLKIEKSERDCGAANEEAKADAHAAWQKVIELQGGVIVDQARTQVACNVAMGEMADATRSLAEEIRVARLRREKKDEESDVHRVVRGMQG